jgi:hypothetical protein
MFFSLVCVKLSPFGTSTTIWPTVPAPDTDDECGEVGGIIGRGSRSTRRKLVAALFGAPQTPPDLTLARM